MRALGLPVPGEKSKRDRKNVFPDIVCLHKRQEMARTEEKNFSSSHAAGAFQDGLSGLFHAIIINFIASIRMAEATSFRSGELFYCPGKSQLQLFLIIFRALQ